MSILLLNKYCLYSQFRFLMLSFSIIIYFSPCPCLSELLAAIGELRRAETMRPTTIPSPVISF